MKRKNTISGRIQSATAIALLFVFAFVILAPAPVVADAFEPADEYTRLSEEADDHPWTEFVDPYDKGFSWNMLAQLAAQTIMDMLDVDKHRQAAPVNPEQNSKKTDDGYNTVTDIK